MASSKLAYAYPDKNNLLNNKIRQVDPEKNWNLCLKLKNISLFMNNLNKTKMYGCTIKTYNITY